MFYEDALVAARALELTLTSRSKDANGGGIPMCGVPFHAVDGYIARLVKKGFRVAICDQVEDPRKAKGVVKREVVRVVSPGTLDRLGLSRRARAGVPHGGRARAAGGRERRRPPVLGVALLDLSTGEFTAAEYAGADGIAGARRRAGRAPAARDRRAGRRDRRWQTCVDHRRALARPGHARLRDDACRRLDVRPGIVARARCSISCGPAASRASASIAHPAAVAAAGALVHHLRGTQKVDLAHVRSIAYRQRADALLIDPTTLKHLEIIEGSEGGRDGSLLDELDRTITSIGSRLLRSWLLRPLVSLEPIRDRLDAVEELAFRIDRARQVPRRDQGGAGSRAAGRARGARHGRAARSRRPQAVARRDSARDARCSATCRPRCVRSLLAELDELPDVRDAIEATLDRRAAGARARRRLRARRRRPRARRAAHHQPVGQAAHRRDGRARARPHGDRLAQGPLQPRLRLLHRDLEVEPARGAARLSPQADDRRRRALHHAGAQGIRRESARRRRAHRRARAGRSSTRCARAVAAEAPRIQASARALAALDVLAALAEAAAVNNYTKPHVHDGDELAVVDGRHPVVERRTSPVSRSCRTTSR